MRLVHVGFLAAVVKASYQDDMGFGFQFSSKETGDGTSLVCITGHVKPNSYIGFGIPSDPVNPSMTNSEITVVYYDTANTVHLLHGNGRRTEQPIFSVDRAGAPVVCRLSAPDCRAVSGFLNACFVRSTLPCFSKAYPYIWATGPVISGYPRYHMSNRGCVENAVLCDASANKNHTPPHKLPTKKPQAKKPYKKKPPKRKPSKSKTTKSEKGKNGLK
ncbi:hypothetical protein BC830DRAFT_1170875 [Chytriomyces sp. MP71]|nr:hypothetical protein BC830DRAFT_1170875 [Chytriomyces sp. MP71]